MSDLVEVARAGEVALVTLNRPEKRNALSIALRRELAGRLGELSGDPGVAVVILTGAGPAFCAGMDVTEFGGDAAHRRELFDCSQRLIESLATLSHPAIAAVNGPALGGGFVLAAMCDLRIASPAATFGHPEIARGIPPSFAALRRVLPGPVAREMAFTGRILDANTALALGLVREVAEDPVARARELACEMAAHGAAVLQAAKGLAIAAEDPGARAAWEEEAAMFHAALFGDP